ncbi:uncharacterized protein LOC143567001 [Bidens hawaiensis]|uniref:uncharacterized protein LOC143567001 n=1 Tax=Bidens hawaiensis TaxID=980011 RepID=UPI00404AB194
MAPLTKVVLLLTLFALLSIPPCSSIQLVGRRDLLEKIHVQDDLEDGVQLSVKKMSSTTLDPLGTTTQTKNKSKLITPKPKPKSKSTSNSTKIQDKNIIKKLNSTSKPSNLTKPTSKTTNSTKPISKTTNSTKPISKTTNSTKPISKNTNSTKPISKNTKPISKTTNPTKPTSNLTQKSSDQIKKPKPIKKDQKSTTLTFKEDNEDNDLVSEFRDLPTRFQETFIPDLEALSKTSKSYYNKANKQITTRVNPIVGKKYAPIATSFISFAFILIPFLLVSLIFNRIKAYFSLQKLIIFIQIYLSIYFSILALSSLVTGLEPLKFFYSTSQSTYVCLQLLQTLAYVLYLLLLLMYLVLVFSTDTSVVCKLLGFGQTFVGLAVGLHYYVTVFHKAVLRQPPKTSWKVHGVYATCFLLICLLGTAERRKKAYVDDDGNEEGKKN